MRYDFENIVITGASSISAAGNGLAPLLELIKTGGSAMSPVPAEYSSGRDLLWGRASAFKASEFIPPLKARKLDRCSQFAVAATGLALSDAGLDVKIAVTRQNRHCSWVRIWRCGQFC
jgi:3-oxoacyl-[acyl-carrier-protein] synthase II